MTRRGLYLQGGGAKGAYQAGIMQALYEKGITFEAISGTSIGSVNSFFWATGHMDELKTLWFEMDLPSDLTTEDDLFYNVEFLIELIGKYNIEKFLVENWFVNYALVKEGRMINQYENLVNSLKNQILECILYSSKLPIRDKNKDFDLSLYEGMIIDGGLINNAFIEPLINLKLDEIIIIPLNRTVNSESLDTFEGKVTILYPPIAFEPGDTIRLDKNFIEKWFKIGYEIGIKGY